MENFSILSKIQSNYILKDIFAYIPGKAFELKLFFYSKYFQKRMDLKLVNYQESYLNQFDMELQNYLYFSNQELEKNNFNKNILKEKLDNDISKNHLDIKKIETIIINYFQEIQEENKSRQEPCQEIPIDIYSPFLNCISKTKFFEFGFSINIFVDLIEKYNLKEDYIDIFNKLNKSGSNYSSLYIKFTKEEDINNLKDFNLDFQKLKRLSIIKHFSDTEIEGSIYSNDNFLKTLFSFNLSNNLVYLKISLLYTDDEIGKNAIENLNCLQSLKTLLLSSFHFLETFQLKIKSLSKLEMDNCRNISFDEDIFLNLKNLFLTDCIIAPQDWILKIPNLENCSLVNIDIEGIEGNEDRNLEEIFGFSTCKKLKFLEIDTEKFLFIESPKLEIVSCFPSRISKNSEIEVLKKLILSEYLKKIDFYLYKINDDDILSIDAKNVSVEKMKIHWANDMSHCILYNLQNKFKNLNNLVVIQGGEKLLEDNTLEIKENKNCKVTKINLKLEDGNVKIYCQSYDTLIKLKIEEKGCYVHNLENAIPIFSKDCKVIFKSLTIFKLMVNQEETLNKNILDNIYNNFKAMPNLKKLLLDFIVKELDEEYYKKFIKKILSMKIPNVHVNIKKDSTEYEEYYSEKDYNELFPDISFDYKYEEIYILKFKKEKEKEEENIKKK